MDSGFDKYVECIICNNTKYRSEVIKLKCTHIFCWLCIENYLLKNLDNKVKCPMELCNEFLTDSEMRKVLSDDDIAIYDKKCLSLINNIHKCLIPTCGGTLFPNGDNNQYSCTLCTLYNCVVCKAPHTGYTCDAFKSLSLPETFNLCKGEINRAKKISKDRRRMKMREKLLSEYESEIVYNDRIFECRICVLCVGKGDGVVLKNCCCHFCKWCLTAHILSSETLPVVCPLCEDETYEAEIYNILSPEDFPKYIKMINDIAKNQLDSYFECRAMDCGVLHHTKATTTSFTCAKCKALNCIKCKAVHINETCEQYKVRLSSDKNQQFIEEQIRLGLIWPCIVCQTHLRKISGYNWVKCPSCNTELCWIRKMRRWGPGGRGDISGGCKCMVNGIPCHNDCIGTCLHDRWLQL